jgi:hypothetical protein
LVQLALDNSDGLVRVIITRAKDPQARPSEIEACYPRDDLVMKVTRLDGRGGTFELQLVDGKGQS